jgi:hypothetical protein
LSSLSPSVLSLFIDRLTIQAFGLLDGGNAQIADLGIGGGDKLVIRTPISNPSSRSYLYFYATLQMEPRRAEASGSETVRYVEADATSGDK